MTQSALGNNVNTGANTAAVLSTTEMVALNLEYVTDSVVAAAFTYNDHASNIISIAMNEANTGLITNLTGTASITGAGNAFDTNTNAVG